MASPHLNPLLQLAQSMAAQGLAPPLRAPVRRPEIPERREPEPPEPQEEEAPRCHLHRKQNKACKFCKAFAQFQEQRTKQLEDRRTAALEKLREDVGPRPSGERPREDEKVPLPNLVHFPQVLRERILSDRYYTQVLSTSAVSEVRSALFSCDSCEPEVRGATSLDTSPSPFFCSVFRLLMLRLTEGQLQAMLNNRSRWVRCAGFLYVRLGVHFDRYWELLSDALMDPEEFVPFPDRGAEQVSEGQFVEQLLTKEKYCEFQLPRLAAAQRRLLNERLVLYDQFRQRYAANLEVLERFEEPGVEIEVCSHEGEWARATTDGPASPGRRRVTVPVRLQSGEELQCSIGMLIRPGGPSSDLASSRGRSYQDLLERYREQQRESAVASGKDYCKSSGRHTVHAGGQTFICGEKRGRDLDEDDDEPLHPRKSGPSREHEAKMAAIMEKYCSTKGLPQARPSRDDGVEKPERMRLG